MPLSSPLKREPNLGESQDWVKCCKFGLILLESLSLKILLFGFGWVHSCVIKRYHFKALLAEFFFRFHLSYWWLSCKFLLIKLSGNHLAFKRGTPTIQYPNKFLFTGSVQVQIIFDKIPSSESNVLLKCNAEAKTVKDSWVPFSSVYVSERL